MTTLWYVPLAFVPLIVLVFLAARAVPSSPGPFAPTNWVRVGIPVAFWLLYLLVITFAVSSGSRFLAFLDTLPMSLFMLACVLASTVRIRSGSSPRCAACEYDLSGIESTNDPRCPECGSHTARPGAVVTGQPVWHRGRLALLFVLTLPFLVSVLLPFLTTSSFQSQVSRIIPTDSLIKHVSDAGGFTIHQWDILRARTLTPEQRDRLALGLLRRSALQLHAWGDEAKWLIAEAAANRLSPQAQIAVLERFLSPSIEPISPPAPAPVVLAADDMQAWGLAACFPNWSFSAIVGPIRTPSDTRPASSFAIPIDPGPLAAPPNGNYRTPPGPRIIPQTFARGETFTVWFVATPTPFPTAEIIWTDGKPTLPPDAVVFSRTYRSSPDAPAQ
jgi:hypothetical protein